MASVLVDLDDISYIDDITDDDLVSSEGDTNPKTKRRKRNIPVGELLVINPNDALVNELRNDRKEIETKRKLQQNEEVNNQCNRDLETLQALIKDRERQKVIQDLREERARLNSDIETATEAVSIERNSETLELDLDNEIILHELKSNKMTTEKDYKLTKEFESTDRKRKSDENLNTVIDKESNSNDVKGDTGKHYNTMLEYEGDSVDEVDARKVYPLELAESHHFNCSDKSKLVKTDSSHSRHKGKRQRATEDGKENMDVVNRNANDLDDNKMIIDKESDDDKINLLQSKVLDNEKFEEIYNKEESDYNGAKPKLFTRRRNGHDVKLKELSLEIKPCNETPYSKQGKDTKKKSKALKESPELNLQSTGSDIKILVTDAEGTEQEASMSESSMSSKETHRIRHSSSTNPTTSPISTIPSSSTMNYLRQLSEENVGKKQNLAEQAELYKLQKVKPFQKLTRVKCGQYSAGIEGDSKRSYIKTFEIMPDKRLIMFDRRNKCLKLFDNDFNPLDRVSLTTKYCGLTVIFDESFAASLPTIKQLHFYHIDSDTNKITRERTHPMEGEFYSITYYHHRLYLIQRIRVPNFTEHDEWEIKKMNINRHTEEMKTIRKYSPGHKDCNLLANEHGLYLTNQLENEVLLLKHDGTLVHRHKVELSLPVGITADRQGNIFICGGSVTSFIEINKPDLQRYRIIYKKTSSNPVAMCYDQDDNILYISDQIAGKIIKYKIHHSGTVQDLMKAMLIKSPSQQS